MVAKRRSFYVTANSRDTVYSDALKKIIVVTSPNFEFIQCHSLLPTCMMTWAQTIETSANFFRHKLTQYVPRPTGKISSVSEMMSELLTFDK